MLVCPHSGSVCPSRCPRECPVLVPGHFLLLGLTHCTWHLATSPVGGKAGARWPLCPWLGLCPPRTILGRSAAALRWPSLGDPVIRPLLTASLSRVPPELSPTCLVLPMEFTSEHFLTKACVPFSASRFRWAGLSPLWPVCPQG